MEALIDKKQLAAALGVGRSTLDRWRACGWIPGEIRLGTGSVVRWRASVIAEWIGAGCPRDFRAGQE